MKLSLNLLEHMRFDQAGNWDCNDFLVRLALAGSRRLLIELPLADIDRVGQDLMNRANPKAFATSSAMAIAV